MALEENEEPKGEGRGGAAGPVLKPAVFGAEAGPDRGIGPLRPFLAC